VFFLSLQNYPDTDRDRSVDFTPPGCFFYIGQVITCLSGTLTFTCGQIYLKVVRQGTAV